MMPSPRRNRLISPAIMGTAYVEKRTLKLMSYPLIALDQPQRADLHQIVELHPAVQKLFDDAFHQRRVAEHQRFLCIGVAVLCQFDEAYAFFVRANSCQPSRYSWVLMVLIILTVVPSGEEMTVTSSMNVSMTVKSMPLRDSSLKGAEERLAGLFDIADADPLVGYGIPPAFARQRRADDDFADSVRIRVYDGIGNRLGYGRLDVRDLFQRDSMHVAKAPTTLRANPSLMDRLGSLNSIVFLISI